MPNIEELEAKGDAIADQKREDVVSQILEQEKKKRKDLDREVFELRRRVAELSGMVNILNSALETVNRAIRNSEDF